MKKYLLAAVPIFAALLFCSPQEAQAEQHMHRLYNPNSGEHFYTANGAEKDNLTSKGWKYEGTGWIAPDSGDGDPVYRLYNKNAGDHHYTLNTFERDMLIGKGWKDEGISWYSAVTDGRLPLYRQYNPNAKAGSHNYTTSKGEHDHLVNLGWKDEGIAWYAVGLGTPVTVEPRKVDEGITTVGGGAGTNPNSYRLLYSNKPFDTNADGSLPIEGQTPTIEFSAHLTMSGTSDDFGAQMVIAGNGGGAGQIGLDTGYQEGTSLDFSQGRTSVKTISFPANAGVTGEQWYSTNTSFAGTAKIKTRELNVRMQYFDNPGYMTLYVDGKLAGAYNTKLSTNNNYYTLHVEINDIKNSATLKIRDLKVLRDGNDVTDKGAPSFVRFTSGTAVSTSADVVASSYAEKGIHGNF